jgi:PAS domain S-box-containing protein
VRGLWRPLCLVGGLLTLLTYLLLASANPDLTMRNQMHEQLQQFELRDAELTRDSVLARAGLLHNYDGLLRDRNDLLSILVELRQTTALGTAEARSQLRPLIDALSIALEDKLDKLERFKTDDALLRNSIAYLTYTMSQAGTARAGTLVPRGDAGDLPVAFLRFLEMPNAKTSSDFSAAMDRLASPTQTQDDQRSLGAHGALVVELLPQVVELLRQIASEPTSDRARTVDTAIEKISARAESRAQRFRYVLFIVSLALLAYLAHQFLRLRASALALRQANTGLNHEIREREQVETALRASEERFRAIAESAHDAIISVDSSGAIVSWNSGAEVIFGWSAQDILGVAFDHVLVRQENAAAPLVMAEMGATLEATGRRRDGTEFPLEASIGRWTTAQGSFVTTIIRDVSARKQLEETARQQELRLVQANKLAALGTLVSGVAHEINNPNQMILLNGSVLVDTWRDACAVLDAQYDREGSFSLAGLPYTEMREGAAGLIRDMSDGARRIDRIVQDLKDFARPQLKGLHGSVDVNEIVTRALRLLAHLVSQRTRRLETTLAPSLPAVRGDAQQIEQVVVNLVVNALQSLPETTHGVRIATSLDPSSGWVVIDVEDEGTGIAPQDLPRLCDPFFTTRHDSGGTGLGLSVTSSLVKLHGGRLDFSSELGRGTCATVTLPPSDSGSSPAARKEIS